MTYDIEDGEEGYWEYQKEPEASLDTVEITKSVEASLNTVVGLIAPKMMKIGGFLRDQAVVTLIDPRATHNFISKDLVKKLRLLLRPNDIYKFMTLLPKDYYLFPGNDTKNLLRPNCMM